MIVAEDKCFVTRYLRFYHFFLDSSIDTPPGPREVSHVFVRWYVAHGVEVEIEDV